MCVTQTCGNFSKDAGGNLKAPSLTPTTESVVIASLAVTATCRKPFGTAGLLPGIGSLYLQRFSI